MADSGGQLTEPSPPPACASLSIYTRNALLDHLFGKSTFTMPTIWVGLQNSGGTEFSAGNYARVETASTDWSTSTELTLAVTSLVDFEFGVPSANWGIAAKIALYDAESGGNELASEDLDELVEIVAGLTSVTFAAGDVSFGAQGRLEDAFLNAMLNHLFGHAVMESLDECWIALCDNYGDEPGWSGSGYYREQMLPADWNDAADASISNAANVAFGQPLSNWGNIYLCRLYSHSTYGDSGGLPSGGATLIAEAWFIDSRDVTTVDAPPEFLAGRLRVRLI